jgi:hypothetical protein
MGFPTLIGSSQINHATLATAATPLRRACWATRHAVFGLNRPPHLAGGQQAARTGDTATDTSEKKDDIIRYI